MDYKNFMKQVNKRRSDMAKLRKKGLTFKQIGDKYKVSAQRVQQILGR